jgi:hypothetical protein
MARLNSSLGANTASKASYGSSSPAFRSSHAASARSISAPDSTATATSKPELAPQLAQRILRARSPRSAGYAAADDRNPSEADEIPRGSARVRPYLLVTTGRSRRSHRRGLELEPGSSRSAEATSLSGREGGDRQSRQGALRLARAKGSATRVSLFSTECVPGMCPPFLRLMSSHPTSDTPRSRPLALAQSGGLERGA